MRTLLIAFSSLAVLTACATSPEPKTEMKAEASKHVPQCYSGDAGKFFNVGEKTTISGIAVDCVATTDGKNGQWMGAKHGK